MKLSVIIPTHNRAEALQKTLEAYGKQNLEKTEFELIVIDDGSSDGTQALANTFIEQSAMNIRLLTLPDRGLPAARNAGIKDALGDIILLMNADTMPLDHDFLKRHIDS